MSNALGAVLQGLERGAGMGLNMYQALNAESRAKRQEQFQIDRANRQDFESDRSHDYSVGRDKVGDEQWERNFEELTRQFNAGHDVSLRQTAVQERQAATQEGTLSLNNRKFQYGVDETERARNESQILTRANANLYGPDGQRLTGQALVERLNSDPQAMKDILSAAVVKGLIPEDRAGRYSGMRVVPMGDSGNFGIMVAGKTEDGSPIRAGGAPLTENGTTSPDDQVMVFNPDSLGMLLDPEGHRTTMRDNALIASDAEKRRDALGDIDKEREAVAAEIELAEERRAAVKAQLEEHLASKPPEPEPLSGFQGSANRGRRLDNLDRTRNLAAWEKQEAELRSSLDPFAEEISRRQQQLEANEEHHRQSLAGIDRWEQEQRIEGDYPARRTARQAEAQKKQDAADKDNRKTVDTAVSEINATQKARFGKKASHLDPNMVQAQYDRLPPEMRQRLTSAPGLLRRAVSHMGENGLTSFEYLLDLTDVNDEGMQHYYKAAEDPAVRSQVGENPNQVHAVAKAVATHMTANPGVSYGQTMEAVLNNKPLPEKNNSLGAAASRAADKWVAPAIRDMFR